MLGDSKSFCSSRRDILLTFVYTVATLSSTILNAGHKCPMNKCNKTLFHFLYNFKKHYKGISYIRELYLSLFFSIIYNFRYFNFFSLILTFRFKVTGNKIRSKYSQLLRIFEFGIKNVIILFKIQFFLTCARVKKHPYNFRNKRFNSYIKLFHISIVLVR